MKRKDLEGMKRKEVITTIMSLNLSSTTTADDTTTMFLENGSLFDNESCASVICSSSFATTASSSTAATATAASSSGPGNLYGQQQQQQQQQQQGRKRFKKSSDAAATTSSSFPPNIPIPIRSMSSNDSSNTNTNTNTDKMNDVTDADLAKEMNALSVVERQKVLEELHGVAEPTHEETPTFIETSIEQFDMALKKNISKAKRRSYEKALFLRPSYATDIKFKLMFLRADHYDIDKATLRLVKFFDWKLRLFGETKLGHDICLDDLNQSTINVAVLSGGCLQLPYDDPTGRPITMFDTSKVDISKSNDMLQFTYYLLMSALEGNDIAQIKGLCNLTYAPSKRTTHFPMATSTEALKQSGDLMSSLPARVTAYHYCTDNPALQFVLSIIRIALGKQVRLRIRSHFGSALEVKYSLMTFGIDCKHLLSSEDGKTEMHDQYLQDRQRKEETIQKQRTEDELRTGFVLSPKPNDVLIGRGRPYHEFPGTRKLIQIIDSQLDKYYDPKLDTKCESSRFNKTCINIQTVKTTKDELGGRFLARTPKGWKILTDTEAREKTANLFRYRYNLLNKQQQNQPPPQPQKQQPQQQQQQQYQQQQQHHHHQGINNISSNNGGIFASYGGGGGIAATLSNNTNNNKRLRSNDFFFDDHQQPNNNNNNYYL